jgi:GT2 family glycosyltransferase
MFFKKTVFDAGMFLNEKLHYSMDADFFIRLARAGYSFKHIGKSLAFFRQHDDAKSIKDKHLQLIEGYGVRRALCFEGYRESTALIMIKILKRIYYTKRVYLKVLAHIEYKCFKNEQARL